jgi:AraC-like DNA-binding protein
MLPRWARHGMATGAAMCLFRYGRLGSGMDQPQVVWANWYQAMAGEEMHVSRLESRMLLWCHRGAGQVWVDGASLPLTPGGFALLPWGCAIRYLAARRQPYLLGGVHLVPRSSAPWRPGAAHGPGDPYHGHPGRRDDPALPRSVVAGAWEVAPALHRLVEHLAERWTAGPPDVATATAQGHLLHAELLRLDRSRTARDLPVALSRVVAAMAERPALPWSLADLAAAAGCSPAWLTRQFAQHLRCSPRRHLATLRLERACALLRSSDLSIAAIGTAVGIPDRFRFAKVFRTAYGLPPSAWRRRGMHG